MFTATSTTRKFRVGSVRRAVNGTDYMYVKAGAAIAQYDACRFNAGLEDVRPTSAAGQVVIGVAQVAIASGSYGWIAVRGLMTAKVVAATAAGSPLVTNATAGTLALADATAITGPRAVATVTGVAAGSAVFLS
jgi:hypothetical protein